MALLQTVVQSELVEWDVYALQLIYNGICNQRGGLALYFLQQCVSGLSVNQRYDGLLLVCADNGVPLPVARAQSEFDPVGPFFNANTGGYVPTTISPRPTALAPLLLAAQFLVELAACGFVRINPLVDGFVAYSERLLASQPLGNLLRAPALQDAFFGHSPSLWRHLRAIVRLLPAPVCHLVRLLGVVAPLASIAPQLAAYRAFVASNFSGDGGWVEALD